MELKGARRFSFMVGSTSRRKLLEILMFLFLFCHQLGEVDSRMIWRRRSLIKERSVESMYKQETISVESLGSSGVANFVQETGERSHEM